LELIDDEITVNKNFTVPLKLMCMYSVANGGLKSKVFDQFKREFCHAYGPKHIFTFQHLEKLGLFTQYASKSKAHYANLSSSFNLVIDHISGIEQGDVSHVFHGYAPLSIRLVQLASKSIPDYSNSASKPANKSLTWQGCDELLKLIPGKTFEESVIPESKSFKSSSR
jgi:vacuolar protein sorting-associated protein 33A